jgi:hypothetical protein
MAERDTRIRWTGRERDLVVNEYRTLCASNLGLPMLELLVAAQNRLPKERQRPPSYALRAWFNKELKAARERSGQKWTRTSRQFIAGRKRDGAHHHCAEWRRHRRQTAWVRRDLADSSRAVVDRRTSRCVVFAAIVG